MKEENKELLLKDLSQRAFYGARVDICLPELNEEWILRSVHRDSRTIEVRGKEHAFMAVPIVEGSKICKPYLRPLSTISDEEWKDVYATFGVSHFIYDKREKCFSIDDDFSGAQLFVLMSWLLSHHFDINGLIDLGLALKAPKNMYKYERS